MFSLIHIFILMQILFATSVAKVFLFILLPSSKFFTDVIGDDLSRAISTLIGMTYLSVTIIVLKTILEGKYERRLRLISSSIIVTLVFYLSSILKFRDPYGLIFLSLATIPFELWMALIAYRCSINFNSNGMFIIFCTSLFSTLGQLLRIEEALFGTGTFYFLQFTWKTNFLLFCNVILNLGVNIGYFWFSLERAQNRAEILAQRTDELEKEKIKIENLLRERDQMLIKTSRLSSINKLSIYTAAIIHEITQPLNALKLAISNAKNPSVSFDADLKGENFSNIDKIMDEIQDIIVSLRSIISKGQSAIEVISPYEIFDRILSITTHECNRRGINFQSYIDQDAILIEVNPILFQRVIFNLITNSIEQLDFKASADKLLTLRCYSSFDINCFFFEVTDNCIFLEEDTEFNLSLDMIVDTEKMNGMGLGLAFTNSILQNWNGTLNVIRTREADISSTTFRIVLPLVKSDLS